MALAAFPDFFIALPETFGGMMIVKIGLTLQLIPGKKVKLSADVEDSKVFKPGSESSGSKVSPLESHSDWSKLQIAAMEPTNGINSGISAIAVSVQR